MTTIPDELQPFVQANRLEVRDGAFAAAQPWVAYLQAQRNLTHVAIAEDVTLPDCADGMKAYQALALALNRGKSPNLLEANVAGGSYRSELAALCDGNRREAIALLGLARDGAHALSKQECLRIKERLPAMLAIAQVRGVFSSEHSMARPELLNMLIRIGNHSSQYGIDAEVAATIEQLQPAAAVACVDHAGQVSSSPAVRAR